MTNRIQEHKIIALQAIIFVSLLAMLSFILEGCSTRNDKVDKVEIENQSIGLGHHQNIDFITLS